MKTRLWSLQLLMSLSVTPGRACCSPAALQPSTVGEEAPDFTLPEHHRGKDQFKPI